MLRNSMVAALSSVLIVSLTPVFSFAQSEDPAVRGTVPRTNPAIMVDGVFSSGEWNRAAKVELPQVANIYFQTSAEFAGNSWRIRFELTPLNAENKPGPPSDVSSFNKRYFDHGMAGTVVGRS